MTPLLAKEREKGRESLSVYEVYLFIAEAKLQIQRIRQSTGSLFRWLQCLGLGQARVRNSIQDFHMRGRLQLLEPSAVAFLGSLTEKWIKVEHLGSNWPPMPHHWTPDCSS